MQIEAGKFYRTNSGNKAGPAFYENGLWFLWAGGRLWTYNSNGVLNCFRQNDPLSLVAEWSDEAAVAPKIDPADVRVGDVVHVRVRVVQTDVGHNAPYQVVPTDELKGVYSLWIREVDLVHVEPRKTEPLKAGDYAICCSYKVNIRFIDDDGTATVRSVNAGGPFTVHVSELERIP